VDGIDHLLDGAVKQALGILLVASLDQRRRADDIGEEDGDLLPLAFEGGALWWRCSGC
jgi:hypothetical protein